MNIIFQINGGIGKCVMATAVCQAIKKKYPDSNLIVVSAYPDVFLNNPHVNRAYSFGSMSYFFDEYIDGKEIKILAHDPYLETAYIGQKEHLIKTWCEMYDVPYNGELPNIHLTAREAKFFQNMYASDRPIMVIHPHGGAQTSHKYSWARDIPTSIVVKIIDHFKNDYNIVQIKRDDQLSYEYTTPFSDSIRATCVLVAMSSKRLFIDSFSQHVAAAMGMSSTVCWIAHSPSIFGYTMHDNMVSNPYTAKPELRNSYLNKFNLIGELLEFPYQSEDDIFNLQDIIKSIENQK